MLKVSAPIAALMAFALMAEQRATAPMAILRTDILMAVPRAFNPIADSSAVALLPVSKATASLVYFPGTNMPGKYHFLVLLYPFPFMFGY